MGEGVVYARPSIGGTRLDFGVSGKLWRHTLVLYDRQTRTLWSQHSHRAIAGPHEGTPLEIVDSEIATWRSWKRRHPSTTALVKPGDGGALRRAVWAGVAVVALALVLVGRRREVFTRGYQRGG